MHRLSRRGAGLVAGSLAAGLVLVPLAAAPAAAVPGSDSAVFINEFHYDNVSTDTGEFIEIAGPVGTDLSGWSIVRYNGTTPTAAIVYTTPSAPTTLSGVITGPAGGYGTVVVDFPVDGLQNGGNDGFALVNGTTVVQLLSYEGEFTASNGPAVGQTSTNLPVSQATPPAAGSSLQLTGTGSKYGDFTWTATTAHTKGAPNTGQTFTGVVTPPPPPPPTDECGDPVVRIHQIQGSGATFDPAYGGKQSVEGVVTAVVPALSGYYLQEEAADGDADATTSEGIFVRAGADAGVVVGQHVRATGTVGEFTGTGSSQTQISGTVVSKLCGDADDVTATDVSFPLASASAFEHYEGMLIRLVDELVISESFNYDRFGEVVVAKPLDGLKRLFTPTAVVEPGPQAQALAAEYALRRITIDDLSGRQNPTTIPHPGNGAPFGQANLFRAGDTITGITGVVDHTFGLYRLQPTQYGAYAAANPRPASAPAVGGDVQVASFNVLNYFLTLDPTNDPANDNKCGPAQNVQCRGANTHAEFERQRAKILAALIALDADVVGLMEMENTPGVEPAADLVDGLNDHFGAGTYDYIDTGVIGTDAIRLGLLYKPGVVRPAGEFAVLDSSVDPRFIDMRSRPMLTQTFDEVATGGRFTLSVNHLKSKGSACAGDPDTGDGSGNCNITRTQAAEAIVDFLAGDPTRSGDPDHLVIGDLNSYDHEDPIDALAAGGFADLIKQFGGEHAYGYVFDGQVGYLDHALANASLTPQVTGAAEWHINADEPDILDFNLDFGKPAAFYAPDAYRSSDHDAVLVGLDLAGVTPDRCYSDGCQTVSSYRAGRRGNGTVMPSARRDPSQALGLSDPDPIDPYWVSLGLGGELVLKFERPVQNNNGTAADLRIVEVDEGPRGATDRARVSASYDGVTWVALGTVTGTGQVDLGSLPSARYVKIVDGTTTGIQSGTDGYDVDAVEVLTGCV